MRAPPVVDLVQIASGYLLAEAPAVMDDESVCFAEVRLGGVWRAMPGAEPTVVIEHRRGIGGIAVHADGGLVVSGRNLAHKALDQTTTILADRDEGAGRFLYNDLTTDAHGRVYVGAFATNEPFQPDAHGRTGSLLAVDLDLSVRVLDDDYMASNGMGFSPDGKFLYVVETGRHAMWRYELGGEGSSLNKTLLYDFGRELPDGMAVAEDGSLWVAMAGAGNIVVLDKDGTLTHTVDVPAHMVASVCFGGPDRRTLFICTGSHDPTERIGGVFQGRTEVPGVAVPPARLDLSAGKVEASEGKAR